MITIKITVNNKEENIDLLNDYLFSKLFGERGSEKETLYLINVFTEKNFKNLSFEPNELKGRHKNNKKSITDVLVMANNNTIVNIESQLNKQEEFHKRSYFYNSKIQSIFLSVGDDYENIEMTIMINFLDFNLHKLDEYHTIFILCEKKHREYTIDDIMESHYVDFTKFRKQLKKGNIDLNDPKDRLMILLNKNSPQKLVNEVIKMDKIANSIYKKTEHVLQDRAEYLTYIRAEQAELDKKAQIKYGRKKGKKEGREEKELEIAINLKHEGIPFELIAKTTGLDISKIEKL